jgi:hypothetical protein
VDILRPVLMRINTIEGILEWWLLEQKVQHSSSKVAKASRALVEKNVAQELHAIQPYLA